MLPCGWQQMRILGIAFAYVVTISAVMTGVHCWEDHPDVEDHRETDRLYALANAQTGYNEYEREQLEKESQDILLYYKTSQFNRKNDKKD